MLSLWTLNIMNLHFLLSPVKVSSSRMLPGTRILSSTTRIIIPSWNNPKEYILKPKNILTNENTRYRLNIIPSHLLQRKMSPLLQLKSLQNLNTRLLLSLNIRTAQIQYSTGRWTFLTSLHNMLRKWKLSDKFWISLIPGTPCLGPLQLC